MGYEAIPSKTQAPPPPCGLFDVSGQPFTLAGRLFRMFVLLIARCAFVVSSRGGFRG
jgi:hypothetical protein